MDQMAYKAKLMKKLNERSFIGGNKRRTYSKHEGMSRWVGTSIDFNAP